MERQKRKPVPGKNSNKRIRRAVKVNDSEIFSSTTYNHQSTTNNFCPHCAGNSFEDLQGVLETGLCIACEHEKTAWLIQKYQADEEAREKKKFAPIEPGHKKKNT